MPTNAAETNKGDMRPLSIARNSAHAASNRTRIKQLSVLLERSTATASGVNAKNRAASKPAATPKYRRTSAQRSATDQIPSASWGSNTLTVPKPNSSALAASSQNATGGLSSEMNP